MRKSFRYFLWIGVAAIAAAALAYAFRPQPVLVDLATVDRNRIVVSVGDEGVAEIRDVYRVSAPVAGHLLRVEREVGDTVVAGVTELARIEPSAPVFLDIRTQTEARAAVEAAKAQNDLAAAEWERAQAELEYMSSEVARSRSLFARGTIAKQRLDEAERSYRVAAADLLTAQARRDQSRHELQVAEARLVSPTAAAAAACECLVVRAPVDGQILQIIQESETTIGAGDGIVEIGDPGDLQVVVDLLSEDAVKVSEGLAAVIDGWGGPPLNAVVRRVEPFGYTQVSALGIEEQRVDVVLDLVDPPGLWQRLGHGYRVDVRVVLQEVDAVSIPLGAIFRIGESWAAYAVAEGTAVLRELELGARNTDRAEVLGGLKQGDRVVLHPPETIADGTAVLPR